MSVISQCSMFQPRLLSALLAMALPGIAAAGAPLYHLTPLSVAGGSNIQVNDINNAGQMVGYYYDEDFYTHAVVWDADGTAHELALPPGVENSAYAVAINNAGQIVGSVDTGEVRSCLLWNATIPGQYTLISSTPAESCSANAINDNGVVAGGKAGYGTGVLSRAFVWTVTGGSVDYGTQNASVQFQQSRWNAVNAAGRLVGHYNVHSSGVHAIAGQVGTPQVNAMSTMTEDYASIATAINSAGVAVGLGLSISQPALVPVVYDVNGNFTEIPGALLDQPNGGAAGINSSGVIVGAAGIGSASGLVPGMRAWVYRDGVSHDLMAVTDDISSLSRMSIATAVNDSGVIVAVARNAANETVSIRLTPLVADVIYANGFDSQP